MKSEIISEEELAEELHKPIIRTFKKRKTQAPFIEQYLGHRSCRYAIDK